MNKKITVSCGIAAILASAVVIAAEDKPKAAAAENAMAAAPSGDTTIATVNGQKIPLDLFRQYFVERLQQANTNNTPAFQNRVFNEFINTVVTAQDAEKSGLDKDKRFGAALDLLRLQLLSRFAIQNAANTRKPTDEELQKAYDERFGKNKRIEYKARHILVKTEKEAKKIIKELKGGADFAELAKKQSLGPTAKDGGELSWFGAGEMVQPFTDATAALKPGEYSSKPVQTQFGWHIILLEDTREAEPPALQDVTDELTVALQQSMLENYVSELRKRTKLELNPDLIKVNPEGESKPAESK